MSSVPSFSFCSTENVESRWENGKQRSVQIEEDFEIESCRQTGESEVRNKRGKQDARAFAGRKIGTLV